MKLLTKDISIGHPVVPWIIADKLGKKLHILHFSDGIRLCTSDSGIEEFNHLTYQVMGELMVKFRLIIRNNSSQEDDDLVWYVCTDHQDFYQNISFDSNKLQEAVAMCVIGMEEYYEVPEEIV